MFAAARRAHANPIGSRELRKMILATRHQQRVSLRFHLKPLLGRHGKLSSPPSAQLPVTPPAT